MARNNRAGKDKGNDSERKKNYIDYLESHGYAVMTPNKMLNLRNEVTEFVTKRAFIMVLASFLDNGRTFYKDYFLSRKKMNAFMKLCIENVELFDQWTTEDKVIHCDEIADYIYENYGKDFRTAWLKAHQGHDIIAEERAKLKGRQYWEK